MRTFGRKCRGRSKVYLARVRETEKKLLSIGSKVVPLALATQMLLQTDAHIEATQQERLRQTLDEVLQAHRPIEKQSRQLVNGKKLSHCKIVNAYDVTIAPIKKARATVPLNSAKNPASSPRWGQASPLGFTYP